MPTLVKVPSMGESINEVTLLKWHRADGERVAPGEPVAEVETDKANADIPSAEGGVIKHLVQPGTVVKVGDAIAEVDPAGSPKASSATPANATGVAASVGTPSLSSNGTSPTSASAKRPEDLSPATRRAVAETGVDPARVTPTGPGGRLTKEDVEKAAAGKSTPPPFSTETVRPEVTIAQNQSASQPSPPKAQQPSASEIAATTGAVPAAPGTRRLAMSRIRKRIAENLVKAKQSTAMLTTFNEVDMSAIMNLRSTYKEAFEKKHGIGLGFMGFFVRAASIALTEFERVNGQIDGDDIVLFDHVHMGVAVSTDRGLTVPVLKNAHSMSFATIEKEIKRVALAARDGKLGLDDLSGGTFTITNGGIFGSLLSTPILNLPQSAILGMHAIKERPVVIDGQIVVRPMMYLALSYDHRIIDGRESVTFLVRIKQLLEDPTRLLLDV